MTSGSAYHSYFSHVNPHGAMLEDRFPFRFEAKLSAKLRKIFGFPITLTHFFEIFLNFSLSY